MAMGFEGVVAPMDAEVILRLSLARQRLPLGCACGEDGGGRHLDFPDKPTGAVNGNFRARQQEKGGGVQRLDREKRDKHRRRDARSEPKAWPEAQRGHGLTRSTSRLRR